MLTLSRLGRRRSRIILPETEIAPPYRGGVITLATIGTSTITERFADAVAQTSGIRIGVAYSRDLARARAFADRIGAPAASDDLDGLLASGAVDAVYVGSPNGLHAEQARAAIRCGVHVFVEKPAVPTAAEWTGLVAEAAERGVVVFEGMRNAYDPGLFALRELLPEVGVVRRASFAYCQRSARYDLVLAGETPNIFDRAMAGGALLDLGVYPLSAAVVLFGEPEQVVASQTPIATGVDGSGSALLGYPGFVVEIAYSKITASSRPSEIQGESGTIAIDHIAQPRRLVLTRLDGTVAEAVIEGVENNMVYETARFIELVSGTDAADAAAESDAGSDQARTAAVLRTVDRIRAASAH